MDSESSARRPRQRAALCTAGALVVAGALGTLVCLAIRNQQGSEEPRAGRSGAQHLAQRLRTSVYDDNRLRLRLSADSVAVRSPRLIGPLRIGFMRGVFARNVVVETFDPTTASSAAGGTPSIPNALADLLPQSARRGIAAAEIESLHFVRHHGDQVALQLEADHCESASRPTRLVCHDGRLREGSQERRFREAAFDGTSWSVD